MNRAGALVTGTDSVLKGIRSQKVKFVLIDSQVSENTLKKITDKCNFNNIAYVKLPDDVDLGLAIGKSTRKVVGICDQNFVKALEKKLEKVQMFS